MKAACTYWCNLRTASPRSGEGSSCNVRKMGHGKNIRGCWHFESFAPKVANECRNNSLFSYPQKLGMFWKKPEESIENSAIQSVCKIITERSVSASNRGSKIRERDNQK